MHCTSVEWSFVVCHLRDFAGSFRVKAHYESHASVSVILLNYAGLNLTCLPMLMLCSWQAGPFSCILLHTYIQYFYNRVLPFFTGSPDNVRVNHYNTPQRQQYYMAHQSFRHEDTGSAITLMNQIFWSMNSPNNPNSTFQFQWAR